MNDIQTQIAADNCEVLRARLAKYEDAEGRPVGVVGADRESIRRQFDAFVAWPGSDHSTVTTTTCLLFAEQIAALVRAEYATKPSGVVLPERMSKHAFSTPREYELCDMWNKALDEVARLNSSPVSAGVVPKLKAPRAIVKPCNYDGLSHWTHTQSSLVYSTEGEAKAAALADDAEYAAYIYSLLDTQPASAGDDDEPFRCEHAACKSLGEHHPLCEYVKQVCAGVVDERAAFEADELRRHPGAPLFRMPESHNRAGQYQNQYVESAWRAWQARAALSAPSHGEQGREWVPVSERLPGETHAYGCHTDDVLCRTRSGKVIVALLARTTTGDVWYDQQSKERDVTHWMPLPAAPSAGSQGGDS